MHQFEGGVLLGFCAMASVAPDETEEVEIVQAL